MREKQTMQTARNDCRPTNELIFFFFLPQENQNKLNANERHALNLSENEKV